MKINKILSVLLLCFAALLGAEEKPNEPETLLFSYVNHPYIIKHFIPAVRKSYALLGINVEFIEQPSSRNLRFADKGITDGDVAYSDLLVQKYENLLSVGPVLTSSVFVLVCHESVNCDPEVLKDETKMLVLTDATKDGMELIFTNGLGIQLYLINRLNQIPSLLLEGKFQYGIYIFATEEVGKNSFPELNYRVLFETQTHHVINRKHAHLANAISQALSQVLEDEQKTN